MRIVVIDDDHKLLENISFILEVAGYEVLQASSGIEGLRLIHDHHPSLIVCDIMMPDMTGYDVLDELQANSRTMTIPIVFLTSKSEIHDIQRAMQAGADAYLTKPFTEQDLLSTIQKRLEKRHQWELQQRMNFARELVQKQEQEAQRLAQELNQTIRQKLLNIKFHFDMQILNSSPSNASFAQPLQFALDELLTQVNTLSYELYPTMLPHLGLVVLLQWYFNTAQKRLNINIKFDIYNMDARLLDAVELALYRIAQRTIESVAGGADDIGVVLWCDANTVNFSIGGLPGLNPTQHKHLLQLLQEYGHTINASVTMQVDEGDHSTVFVSLPNAVFQQAEVMSLPPTPQITLEDILVMSSDREFLEYVLRLLEPLSGVVSYETDDANILLSHLRTHIPQILILDGIVPTNVLSSLIAKTAVILLSPTTDETYTKQALNQGVMGVIPRVKVQAELLAALQTVRYGVRYVSASLITNNTPSQSTKSLNLDLILTRREREIMELILRDMTHTDIANQLFISPRTVEKHRANMMQKLALNTHTELILFALRHNLISST